MSKSYLLAGTALAALCMALPALAETKSQQIAADAAAVEATEEIVVFGQGETRQVQNLSAAQIAILTPGTSPIKAVEMLPSVNFEAADPFGAYEWAVRISVRGFNQNQLGFTLDGVPLGDMSYGNHNGLHISRAAISENIGQISLAQGSGALDTASSSNLGGSLKFVTRDPDATFGAFGAMTAGTDNTFRPFVRLDTGELGSAGTKAFVSYVYSTTDKWKGNGEQRYNQVNVKLVQPVGEAKLTAYYNFSDRREQDYQDMSLEMIKRLGYNWDNLYPDYARALTLARTYQSGGAFPAPITSVDDAYFDAGGLRRDNLAYIKADIPLGDAVSFSAQGYLHKNKGQGSWITPYVPSPNGSPLSFRTTEYDLDRKGVVASITGTIADNELNAGVWYEHNNFNQARRYYQMGLTAPERFALDFQTNPFFTQWQYVFKTDTTQFHVQDTAKLFDALTVNFGFKSLKVESTGGAVVGTIGSGTIKSEDNFLPQAGLTYDVGDLGQIFASYAENMHAFIAAGTGASPFSTTQAGFDAIKNSLKPEKSRTLEAGWRFGTGDLKGVAALYDVKFKNRLLVVTQGPGILGAPNALSNVGGVSSRGAELGLSWKFMTDWTLFGSYAYNDAKYDDDTVDGAGGRVATKGKTVVDAPKNLIKAELAYDDETLFGRFGVSFTDKRYYTYINDNSVPSHTLLDLTVGYRFSGVAAWLEGLEVQANISNLTNSKYVSTIGSNGFVNSDPTGTNQTLLAGAPLQAFFTIKKKF